MFGFMECIKLDVTNTQLRGVVQVVRRRRWESVERHYVET